MWVIEVSTGKKKIISFAEYISQWLVDGTDWKYVPYEAKKRQQYKGVKSSFFCGALAGGARRICENIHKRNFLRRL